MMNILFYTIIFIIGVVIGCVWALDATKFPKESDMRKVHCSKYAHYELISKLTYILIGGLTSIILANILHLDIYDMDLFNIIIYIFAMIYISTLVLIGGIDRIYLRIEKKILGFGIISSIVYMIYLSSIDLASVHLSAIYMAIYILLLAIDTLLLRKCAKDSYIIDNLILLNIILAFTDLRTLTYTTIMAVIAIAIYWLIQQLQKNRNIKIKLRIKEIPIGYFIAASNIIVLFMIRIFEGYII